MTQFSVLPLPLNGLKLLQPFYVEDHRGYFLKGYEQNMFSALGVPMAITEDFESFSHGGTVRGLHFQTNAPQAKLVRALSGEIFDVAVDLRKNSSTFGQWHAEILSAENRAMFYIPQGFAHGFMVLSGSALVQYKCEGRFDSETDTGIVWNDTDLAICWPECSAPILSDKDAQLQTFAGFCKQFGGLTV